MTKKPIIKKTAKTIKVATKKAPSKKKLPLKIVSDKTRLYNRWFIIFSISGASLAVILFLLIRINIYYDGVKAAIIRDAMVSNENFINRLPAAEAASDPTVSGNFNRGSRQPIWTNEDVFLGNQRAAVKIFYFADYNSQASRDQEKELKKLVTNYPEDVFLVRKDFPGDNSISIQGARANRCAQEQGAFWQYHDVLLAYLNQDQKITQDILYDENAPSKNTQLQESRTFLADIADRANLDLEEFDKCFNNPSSAVITNNIIEGNNLGIVAVPTLYINGQQFSNHLNYEDLERLVKVVIAK